MKTYNEIRTLLPTATLWSFHRGYPYPDSLEIYIDDVPGDLRKIYRVKLPCKDSGSATITKLTNYDPETHTWNKRIGESDRKEFPNRRGEKALRDYILEAAKKNRGYLGSSFTHYRTA